MLPVPQVLMIGARRSKPEQRVRDTPARQVGGINQRKIIPMSYVKKPHLVGVGG